MLDGRRISPPDKKMGRFPARQFCVAAASAWLTTRPAKRAKVLFDPFSFKKKDGRRSPVERRRFPMTVGRFAPSPSGRIHLGNILCCLLAWLSARQKGGKIVLRIEDLDTARCPRRYADQLIEDLRWLGLDWDEGPLAGGPDGPYFQSRRAGLYQAALEKLDALGLVYPCFCTRAELHAASAPHREDGVPVYPGTCRGLSPAQRAERARVRAPGLRLRVPDKDFHFTDGHMGNFAGNLERDCGDFLLRRSDGMFAYQLAVVVDDAAMGVTEVVRGADLLSSTPRQLYLYQLLGLIPPEFCHFPLLLAPDGRRLSKRDADAGLDSLRGRVTAEAVLGKLAWLAGFHPSGEPRPAEALLGEFSWEKVPQEDIRLPEHLFE